MSPQEGRGAYCIALQPVCDAALRHVADKLLYRADADADVAVIDDPLRATMRSYASAVYELGMEQLVGDRLLMFTAPLEWVEQTAVFQLPAEQLIAELQVSSLRAQMDLAILGQLREKGYRVAVEADAFEVVEGLSPDAVDLIKIDMRRPEALELRERFRGSSARLMATFVEQQATLERARAAGFDWYQGFVFAPPFQVRHSNRKRFSNRAVELQIVAELAATEMDLERFEAVLAQHPDFCIMLLKQVNSARYFRSDRRVESLRESLVILGQERVKAIATILLLSQNDEIKAVQTRLLLIRAAMARRIGERVRTLDPVHAFTLGLFSRLDALEQVTMDELLEGIPLSGSLKAALLSREGELGRLLDLLDDYDEGRVAHLSGSVLSMLNDDFVHAAAWAERCLVTVGD